MIQESRSRHWLAVAFIGLAVSACALQPTGERHLVFHRADRSAAEVAEVDRYGRCLLADTPPLADCSAFPAGSDPAALSRELERRAGEAMQTMYAIVPAPTQVRMRGRYLVRMHADAEACFDDLDSPARRESLLRQIDEIGLFLADYHARVLGAPSASVLAPTVVEICSTRLGPGPLYWSGPNTLQIRMPVDRAGAESSVVASARIAQAWRGGEHQVEDVRLFSRPLSLRSVWPVLDPAGTIRTGLRKLIVRRSGELQARLAAQALALDRLAASGAGPAAVRARAEDFMESETGLPRDQILQLTEATAPADALRNWRRAAADPEGLATIVEHAGAAIRPCGPHRGTGERKRLFGLVVVENAHDIYVCVGSPASAAQTEAGDAQRTLQRDVVSLGLVVVSTADVVRVEASLEDEIRVFVDRTRAVARGSFLSAMNGSPAM